MATHSSVLAWRIPWTEVDCPWGNLVCCSPWGHKESDMTKQLNNNNNELKNKHKKENVFSLTVQCLTTGTQGLASSEQARGATDWRRETRWEMVELKNRQQ